MCFAGHREAEERCPAAPVLELSRERTQTHIALAADGLRPELSTLLMGGDLIGAETLDCTRAVLYVEDDLLFARADTEVKMCLPVVGATEATASALAALFTRCVECTECEHEGPLRVDPRSDLPLASPANEERVDEFTLWSEGGLLWSWLWGWLWSWLWSWLWRGSW